MSTTTLKFNLLLGCLSAMFAIAQENPALPRAEGSDTQNRASTVSYSPSQVKVLGDIEYGERGIANTYSRGPRYRAFVFSGYGGDQVEITVTGAPVHLALADSTLHQIATGSSQLCVSLPDRGPDIELWYIITNNAPTRLTFQVKKTGHQSPSLQQASLR